MLILNDRYTEQIMAKLANLGLCDNGNTDYQLYTIKHKQAFVAVELSLIGCTTESGISHDIEKLITYGLMDKKEASKLHRKYAKHHIKNCKTEDDLRDCIIDYECARFTKPDKPKNAYNTIMEYCPEMYDKLKPTLVEFRINNSTNNDIDFRLWNQTNRYITEYMLRKNIDSITRLYKEIQNKGIEEAVKDFYTD